jgi:transcriptional regulator GlxA family with amidase domain
VLQHESGFGYTQQLRTLRVMAAVALLPNQRLRVKEVCARAGFNGNAEMDHAFQRTVRMSPSTYRMHFCEIWDGDGRPAPT